MHASHPAFSNFTMGWIPVQCSGVEWLVVKITRSVYQHKRWSVLTFVVKLLVGNLSCHVKNWIFKNHSLFRKKEMQVPSDAWIVNCAFHKVQWRHFSGVVDRFRNTYLEFLQDSLPKSIHIGWFLTELFKKIEMWPLLGTQCTLLLSAVTAVFLWLLRCWVYCRLHRT